MSVKTSPFILKVKFYAPGEGKKNSAHAKYIATRPGADRGEPELDTAAGHVKYAAERPRSHGLFGHDENITPALSDIQKELRNHDGIVWRIVVSLREDVAQRMNFINRKSWENALRASVPNAAAKMGISESNLRWTAAYHAEKGHPHCHIIMWEKTPQRTHGVLTKGERKDVRKAFIQQIYSAERSRLYAQKNAIRELVRDSAQDDIQKARALIRDIKDAQTEVRAYQGQTPGVPPKLHDEQLQELSKLLNDLAQNMPGRGRIALKYMPVEVKAQAREIADWILSQPGFTKSAQEYTGIARELASHYTMQDQVVKQAGEKAYNDIRDRIAQLVLKESSQTMDRYPDRAVSESNVNSNLSQEVTSIHENIVKTASRLWGSTDEVVNKLWESTGRLTSVAIFRSAPDMDRKIADLSDTIKQNLTQGLKQLAEKIPEDIIGRPPLGALPDEAKVQAREIADWILKHNNGGDQYRNLHINQGGDTAYQRINILRDRIAEKVVAHAMELLPREIPDVKMRVHEGRLREALSKFQNITGDFIRGNHEEATWTAGTMYRSMLHMGVSKEKAQEVVTNWSQSADIKDVKAVIRGTDIHMDFITKKCKEEGRPEPAHVSRNDWERMRDNLGLQEEELLHPWFGVKKEHDNSTHSHSNSVEPEFKPPEIIPERIEPVVRVFETATAKLSDHKEINWTVRSMTQTLYALGVNEADRERIVKGWVQRSGIEISEPRLRDILDRTEIAGRKSYFLGHDNWQRLNENAGVDDAPGSPWKFSNQQFASITRGVWRSAWNALESERTRIEAQAQVENRIQDQKRMQRRQQSRER